MIAFTRCGKPCPTLSRSALHRCLQRHGISRLPPDEAKAPAKKAAFKDYRLGYLHLDFAEVQTQAGKRYLFVAIDRTSKLAFAELQPQATQQILGRQLSGKNP